jgi:hypothetical protein
MFPPGGEAAPGASADAHDCGTDTIDLRDVIRLLPTRNGAADHGGFFVAVVERLGVTAPASEAAAEDATQPAAQPAAEAAAEAIVEEALLFADGKYPGAPCPATLAHLARFFGLNPEREPALANTGPALIEGRRAEPLHLLGSLAVTARGGEGEGKGKGEGEGEGEGDGGELLLSVLSTGARELLASLTPPPSNPDRPGGNGKTASALTATDSAHPGDRDSHGTAAPTLSRAATPSPAISLIGAGLPPSPAISLIGAGLPLFARMPTRCDWWPREAPWRVCQEGAALLAAQPARRRTLRVLTGAAALDLLRQRRVPYERLVALSAQGCLVGLETCWGLHGVVEMGAIVLALPSHEPSSANVRLQPLAVAGLLLGPLDDEHQATHTTLMLLANEDVLARYSRVLSSTAK